MSNEVQWKTLFGFMRIPEVSFLLRKDSKKGSTWGHKWSEKQGFTGGVLDFFLEIWKLKLKKKNRIPSNFKDIVLQTQVKYGNEREWLELYEVSLKTKSPSERLSLHLALTQTQNFNLLKLWVVKISNIISRKQRFSKN